MLPPAVLQTQMNSTGVCFDVWAYHADALPFCSVASLVLAALQLSTVAVVIVWLRRQAALAQMGDEVAGQRLIMPIYNTVLYGIAMAQVLHTVLDLLYGQGRLERAQSAPNGGAARDGAEYTVFAALYGLVWGVSHFISEGVAVFLMQHGAGFGTIGVAVRRGAVAALLTAGAYTVKFLLPSDSYVGFGLMVLWEVVLVAFYGALLLAPETWVHRRPAAMPYALFWLLLRLVHLPSTGLVFWSYDAGYCVEMAEQALFSALFPFVAYRVLLLDSLYWQGVLVDDPAGAGARGAHGSGGGIGRLWKHSAQLSQRLSGKVSTNSNALLRPLVGNSIPASSATHLAHGVSQLSDSKVPILNFQFLSMLEGESAIGVGGTARVYSGTYTDPRTKVMSAVAIKLIFCMELDRAIVTSFCEEARLLAALPKHENVIQCRGVCVMPPAVCLVMDLCRESLHDAVYFSPEDRQEAEQEERRRRREARQEMRLREVTAEAERRRAGLAPNPSPSLSSSTSSIAVGSAKQASSPGSKRAKFKLTFSSEPGLRPGSLRGGSMPVGTRTTVPALSVASRRALVRLDSLKGLNVGELSPDIRSRRPPSAPPADGGADGRGGGGAAGGRGGIASARSEGHGDFAFNHWRGGTASVGGVPSGFVSQLREHTKLDALIDGMPDDHAQLDELLDELPDGPEQPGHRQEAVPAPSTRGPLERVGSEPVFRDLQARDLRRSNSSNNVSGSPRKFDSARRTSGGSLLERLGAGGGAGAVGVPGRPVSFGGGAFGVGAMFQSAFGGPQRTGSASFNKLGTSPYLRGHASFSRTSSSPSHLSRDENPGTGVPPLDIGARASQNSLPALPTSMRQFARDEQNSDKWSDSSGGSGSSHRQQRHSNESSQGDDSATDSIPLNPRFTEVQLLRMSRDCARAIAFLHTHRIVHADIKVSVRASPAFCRAAPLAPSHGPWLLLTAALLSLAFPTNAVPQLPCWHR
jgi:hypothetical protein